jgi:gluconokinase
MIIVVMGVAGAGKTTIGKLLAERLGCTYLEGDALQPRENIEAMRQGRALGDVERGPWLAAIRARMVDAHAEGRSLVVACSALKASYRAQLADGLPVTWVYLKGSGELIGARLRQRTDHFFSAELLESQLETLEEPDDAITVDVRLPPAAIIGHIMAAIEEKDEQEARR